MLTVKGKMVRDKYDVKFRDTRKDRKVAKGEREEANRG